MTGELTHYAQALFDLAVEENCTEQIRQELLALEESFSGEPRFLQLLAAPNIAKAERCDVLDQCFRGAVHPYLLNFLKILTEQGAIGEFSGCCGEYHRLYRKARGILPVQAVSAVAMTREQRERLCQKLQAATGKQVELTNPVDPGCIGGVRLEYDGGQVDGTVKSRLEAMAAMLKNTVL